MAAPLLTPLLPLLLALLLAPAHAQGATPRSAPTAAPGAAKCLACHGEGKEGASPLPGGGAERPGPPAHRRLSRTLPPPPGGWIGCTACHRGDGRTVRKALAHRGLVDAERARYLLPGDALAARGGKVLERSGCRRCHVSGGTGAALAADLDRSTASRFPEELLRAVLVPAAAMPDFRFREEDASALVVALLANGAAAKGAAGAEEAPRVVHFSRPGSGERARHPFAARCGPCHRALTERFGLLGTGIAGPDLSALFTPFHPGRGKGGERWSEGAVPAWARNPRSVRPGALMPPQRLKEGEAEEAAAVLRLSPARLRLPAAAASAGAAAPEALHPPATGAPAGGGVRREGGRARADGR